MPDSMEMANNDLANVTPTSGAFPEDVVLAPEYVASVLSYVKPEERRVIGAVARGLVLDLTMEQRSPPYTLRPVEYLSTADLAMATAQAGQLQLDHLVRTLDSPTARLIEPGELASAREHHLVFFLKFSVEFHRRHTASSYLLSLRLNRFRHTGSILVGRFDFTVPGHLQGSFIACVPYGEALRDGLSD